MRICRVATILLALVPALVHADELPYPPGLSVQVFEDHKVALVLPADLSATKPASLVVVLHGPAGRATRMAEMFKPWADDGYVVCAPKAVDMTWEHGDLKRVLSLAAHLLKVLPIDPEKVHVVGYSHRGSELAVLAMDDDLRPCSATWVAAGFQGRQVPKWAKRRLGVIAIAGSKDRDIRQVRNTVSALSGKVRSVEVREQPGLGHGFPYDLLPYLQWWMGIQEGRITPGDDRSLEWLEDPATATPSKQPSKKGGLVVWVYDAGDTEDPDTAVLQREVFFDADFRFLAGQLPCLKLDKAKHGDAVAKLGVETTPALVIVDREGEVRARHEGPFKVKRITKTLREVAPRKTMPRR